jgi:penicillin amidase
MPRVSGSVRLPGLDSAVEVIRDKLGVPHIYARDAHDLLFAQGFVHTQDRLWQMEFQRRLASGRLAELLGEEALETNRWIRVVGIRRAAERDEKAFSGESRGEIAAYVKGVNAFVATEKHPVELRVLKHEPALWCAKQAWCFFLGESPSWVRSSQPPIPSVACAAGVNALESYGHLPNA